MPFYRVQLSGKVEIDLTFKEYKKLAQVLATGAAKFVILEDKIINTAYIIALNYEPLSCKFNAKAVEEEKREVQELKRFFESLGNRYPQLEN